MTADVKTGVLRLWNVSQSTPTGAVRLNKTAFHTFAFVGGGNQQRVFCAFRDGGIGLYDLRKRLWEFRRKQGHTETIFDCKVWKPPTLFFFPTGSQSLLGSSVRFHSNFLLQQEALLLRFLQRGRSTRRSSSGTPFLSLRSAGLKDTRGLYTACHGLQVASRAFSHAQARASSISGTPRTCG